MGTTAVRKSLKFKDLQEEFSRRLAKGIDDKLDLINYSYFLVRVADFELSTRTDGSLRSQLITKSLTSTITHADKLDFNDVLRNFGDLVQLDPSTGLANRISDILKDKPDVTLHQLWRILRYIDRSKSPRLYSHLVRQSVTKMQAKEWKVESLKNIIFMFNAIVSLERTVYGKFELVNELIKEIMGQRENLA